MFGKFKNVILPVATIVGLASMLAGCVVAPAPGYYRPYHPYHSYHPYYDAPHYYYYR